MLEISGVGGATTVRALDQNVAQHRNRLCWPWACIVVSHSIDDIAETVFQANGLTAIGEVSFCHLENLGTQTGVIRRAFIGYGQQQVFARSSCGPCAKGQTELR